MWYMYIISSIYSIKSSPIRSLLKASPLKKSTHSMSWNCELLFSFTSSSLRSTPSSIKLLSTLLSSFSCYQDVRGMFFLFDGNIHQFSSILNRVFIQINNVVSVWIFLLVVTFGSRSIEFS